MAREGGEILARIGAADLDLQPLADPLLVPELRQPESLAAAIDLLHLLQGAEPGERAKIVAAPVGQRRLERAALQSRDLLQIEQHARIELPRLRDPTARAAGDVIRRFGGVARR